MEVSKPQLMWEKLICMMNQLSRKQFCNHVRSVAREFDLTCIEYEDKINLIDNDGLVINFVFEAEGEQ